MTAVGVRVARERMEEIGKLQKLVRGLEDIALKCLDADDNERARDIMTVHSTPPPSPSPPLFCFLLFFLLVLHPFMGSACSGLACSGLACAAPRMAPWPGPTRARHPPWHRPFDACRFEARVTPMWFSRCQFDAGRASVLTPPLSPGARSVGVHADRSYAAALRRAEGCRWPALGCPRRGGVPRTPGRAHPAAAVVLWCERKEPPPDSLRRSYPGALPSRRRTSESVIQAL